VLADLNEPQRFRILASLFEDLAERSSRGRAEGAPASQIESLNKKIQSLHEDNASVNDSLAATRADLERRQAQLEAEQNRAEELQRIVDEQRGRLELLKKQIGDLEAQLEARGSEVHKAQRENEELLLKLQRTETASDQGGRIESLEQSKAHLAAEVQRLQSDLDQARAAKDAEIEQLKAAATSAGPGSDGCEEMLTKLWQRLAAGKPPLTKLGEPPDLKAAERLADAGVELVTSAHAFEQTMSIFLSKYTKHNPSVKVPWDVYKNRDDVHKTAAQTLAPKGGKPVGLLKMRLRFLYKWTEAAMIGCDSVIESIASELRTHLMADLPELQADPNRKVRDYIRADGAELFLQHMREILSAKLAETYGRGG
jgi:hypothetical protein